jgi:hypothetical protein
VTAVIRGAVAAALALTLVGLPAGTAGASTAAAASASVSFSGTGSTMRLLTSVKFTATYTGTYNVKYDVFRSLSSSRAHPVKVNTRTAFTRTFAATSGTTYIYRPYSSLCPAGSTTYYYWVRASVTDTSSGTLVVRSPVVAAAACTSI